MANYPYVNDINFTTIEKEVIIDECYKLIILPINDCQISLNDNIHYKNYTAGIAIPIELNSLNCRPIKKIYIKGTEEGVCGVWGFN